MGVSYLVGGSRAFDFKHDEYLLMAFVIQKLKWMNIRSFMDI